MKVQRSGIHHLATRVDRNADRVAASTSLPGRTTTQAMGRSSHLGSGTPITAASNTSG